MCLESLVTAVMDMYPSTFRRKNSRELFILAVAVATYLLGLIMLTEVRGDMNWQSEDEFYLRGPLLQCLHNHCHSIASIHFQINNTLSFCTGRDVRLPAFWLLCSQWDVPALCGNLWDCLHRLVLWCVYVCVGFFFFLNVFILNNQPNQNRTFKIRWK